MTAMIHVQMLDQLIGERGRERERLNRLGKKRKVSYKTF